MRKIGKKAEFEKALRLVVKEIYTNRPKITIFEDYRLDEPDAPQINFIIGESDSNDFALVDYDPDDDTFTVTLNIDPLDSPDNEFHIIRVNGKLTLDSPIGDTVYELLREAGWR